MVFDACPRWSKKTPRSRVARMPFSRRPGTEGGFRWTCATAAAEQSARKCEALSRSSRQGLSPILPSRSNFAQSAPGDYLGKVNS